MLTIDLNQSSRDVPAERHLETVTNIMLKAKKTIVVTGAGISCSSGIPVMIITCTYTLIQPLPIPISFFLLLLIALGVWPFRVLNLQCVDSEGSLSGTLGSLPNIHSNAMCGGNGGEIRTLDPFLLLLWHF